MAESGPMFKPLLAQQTQRNLGRKRPTVSLVRACPFTQGCAAGGAEEVTDRLRLSRALRRYRGQEQTCACGSAFAWECGPPSWSPG